jgi:hypothetical protein
MASLDIVGLGSAKAARFGRRSSCQRLTANTKACLLIPSALTSFRSSPHHPTLVDRIDTAHYGRSRGCGESVSPQIAPWRVLTKSYSCL